VADETQTNQSSAATSQSSAGQQAASASQTDGTNAASSSKTGTDGTQATKTEQQGTQQQSAAPSRPDGLPESFWDPAAGKFKAEPFNEILARDAARQSELLTRPKSVDEYKVEPSKEFKAPEGVEFSLDQANPQVANLKAWALRNGVPQAELSSLVDIYGGLVAAEKQTYKAGFDAEVAKLGTAGPARMDAAKTFLDAKGYGALGKVLFTAESVVAIEKLMADMRGQGASTYTGNGRDMGADAGKIAGYSGMTFEQRRQAQDQARQRGR
jgi:hypothetical protein